MRRLRSLPALLAALCLLCACRAQMPAAAPTKAVVQTPPAQSDQMPDGLVREADGRVIYYEAGAPVQLSPGVQMLGGKAYFVEETGGICVLQDCVAETGDGRRYYFENDCSLRCFTAGFAELPDGTYYVEADGYALASFTSEVVQIGGSLYAFDEAGRVLYLEAGVQQIFGSTYLVETAGSAIALYAPGPLLREDGLYFVRPDGALLTDTAEEYLFFGSDGRYTSGNETLDVEIDALLRAGCSEAAEPEDMLRAAYNYIRDNFTYLSMEHQTPGTTDWAETCALTFFDLGKGNCYCWAAALMYCARRLGYQAYVVAGWESNTDNDHAWTMIDWPDGETYLFDAQLEYAYWYMFSGKPKIDMFKAAGDGTYYGTGSDVFAYFFP